MSWVYVAVTAVSTVVKVAGDQAAAGEERAANDRAQQRQLTAEEKALSYLEPGRSLADQGSVDSLKQLVNDPQAQLDYIQKNPLYNVLAKDAQDRLFSNTAAKGKFNSGGTAEALQNALLLTGVNLVNKNISQRSELVQMGLNANTNSATVAQGAGNQLASLEVDRGNINAAEKKAVSEDIGSFVTDMYTGAKTGGYKGVKI